jgi:microcystin-dependent protein
MSEPFIGEIRMFGGSFAPAGWAFCDGRLIAISQNEALFTLLGTIYGGDGVNTFALPDLRGRIPVHQGPGFVLGQLAGSESVTLNINQIASHTHTVAAKSTAVAATAGSNFYGGGPNGAAAYGIYDAAGSVTMNAGMVTPGGGSQPHENMMPTLTITYIIALQGVFPTQN